MGEVETKPVLVGNVELDKGGGPQKEETEAGKPDHGTEGEIPCKWRATQSIASLKECEKKGKYYETGTKMDGVNGGT